MSCLAAGPWLHVGFGVAGGYGALYYVDSVEAKKAKVAMVREAERAARENGAPKARSEEEIAAMLQARGK